MDEIAELVKSESRTGNAYTREYLRQVKRKLEITSDYALAKRLQVSKSAISNYQNGTTAFSDSVCQKVAEILEIDPALVVSFVEVDRHSSASFKELKTRLWIAETVRQALGAGTVHSALFAMLVVLGFITTPPNAEAVVTDLSTSNQSVYYV